MNGLSVVCSVHQSGGMLAASLQSLREIADEIVVGFDSRIDPGSLGPLESIADVFVGFEFTGRNRFRPWLREQASGDWLLLLDYDEVPSTALLDQLPTLMTDRNIAGYSLPRWWAYPDATRRIVSDPWNRDVQMRLMRNDARLWFPGIAHTGAHCDGPTRFVDAPIIHMDLLARSVAERLEKIDHYRNSQLFGLMSYDGRPLDVAYFAPEDRTDLRTELLAAPDAERVRGAMVAQGHMSLPLQHHRTASAREVDGWWSRAELLDEDYSASVQFVGWHGDVFAADVTRLEIDVTNTGGFVWPATALIKDNRTVMLSYHWETADGESVEFNGRRTSLSCRVAPNKSVRAELEVLAPEVPGHYVLAVDVVHEGVRWFDLDARVGVEVLASVRHHLAPDQDSGLVAVEALLAMRRRLPGVDGLAVAMSLTAAPQPTLDGFDLSFGGWALDTETLSALLRWIERDEITRVLEFGSGHSTVVLANQLARRDGCVLTVDQDQRFSDLARRTVEEHGLAHAAQFAVAPIAATSAGGVTSLCYDFNDSLAHLIRSFEPQLVIIDGPSQVSGSSRLGVAPMVSRCIASPAAFVLDDAFRDAELLIAQAWTETDGVRVDGVSMIGKGMLIGELSSI